jgi:pyrimidine operon attenuation protein / uracil phosphoribosyltransferase
MSVLTLDAQALYSELLKGVRSLREPNTQLVGIVSGGAWLAEALQRDLGLAGKPGVISSSAASPQVRRPACRLM